MVNGTQHALRISNLARVWSSSTTGYIVPAGCAQYDVAPDSQSVLDSPRRGITLGTSAGTAPEE